MPTRLRLGISRLTLKGISLGISSFFDVPHYPFTRRVVYFFQGLRLSVLFIHVSFLFNFMFVLFRTFTLKRQVYPDFEVLPFFKFSLF